MQWNILIMAEHFGEWEAIVSMLVFFIFLQGFKGEPGEDGVMVSIIQKHLCVCPPHLPLHSTLQLSAEVGLCHCLWRTKNPSWNYRCPKMDVCPGLPVPRGEKRVGFVSPWLFWRDVVLLYPDSCPSEATWHCNSKLLRFKLGKKVLIILKIHEP